MPIVVSGASWADLPGVSLTATSEASGLGVSALRTPVLGEVWRTGGASPVTLRVNLGQIRSVTAIVLQAPRDGLLPAASDTIRYRLSATTVDGTDVANATVSLAMPRGYWCWVPASPVSLRYISLTFTTTQAYLQFGKLWVAGGLLTKANLSESGFGPTLFDETAQAPRRRVQVTVPGLSESEADLLEDIGVANGTQQQALVIPRVERASRSAVIGKFTAIPSPKPRQAWRGGLLYTASMTIQEDR